MKSIIHLEDNLLDHKLVSACLAEGGFQGVMTRVETRDAFLAAIQAGGHDLILADYSLPHFDGLSALKLVQQYCPQCPVIIVSGAMGEIAAVEILKAGATDYILKDHLERLVPAVKRARREAADRAARREAERQVREARDSAEAANRAKDHFLAVLSHELRTPLTPALTAIQTIETDPALPPHFRDAVQMIRRNIQLEAKLIDDLLDLTRVTRGKLELNLQPTDLHEIVLYVVAICDSDLRGKRQMLQLDLRAVNHQAIADPARLQQILWNLLKNAVKFTEEGGHVTLTTRNTPDGNLELSVTDNGIGIEPDVLARIFEAFEQGGKQITRQFGGLGLGLAISRALADQHKGSLTAASEGPGKGSTFTLRLPVANTSPTAAPTRKAGEVAEDVLKGCRILLVDDHQDTARAMGKLLRQWGCQVHIADSVASALTAALGKPFDLLVSDIGLPDGSGLDLMQQLAAQMPIKGIAVSGFGMDEDLRQSRNAGFSDHLVKPIDLTKLQAILRKLLSQPQEKV